MRRVQGGDDGITIYNDDKDTPASELELHHGTMDCDSDAIELFEGEGSTTAHGERQQQETKK